MEIKIGIRHIAREIVVETSEAKETGTQKVDDLSSSSQLSSAVSLMVYLTYLTTLGRGIRRKHQYYYKSHEDSLSRERTYHRLHQTADEAMLQHSSPTQHPFPT